MLLGVDLILTRSKATHVIDPPCENTALTDLTLL